MVAALTGCGRTDLPQPCPTAIHAERSERWAVSLPAWRSRGWGLELAGIEDDAIVAAVRIDPNEPFAPTSPRCDAPPPDERGLDVVALDRFGEVLWRRWLVGGHFHEFQVATDGRGVVYVAQGLGHEAELRLTRLDADGKIVRQAVFPGWEHLAKRGLSVAGDGKLLVALERARLSVPELEMMDDGPDRAIVIVLSPELEVLDAQHVPDGQTKACITSARWAGTDGFVVSFDTPCSDITPNDFWVSKRSTSGDVHWTVAGSSPVILDAPSDVLVTDADELRRLDGDSGATVWAVSPPGSAIHGALGDALAHVVGGYSSGPDGPVHPWVGSFSADVGASVTFETGHPGNIAHGLVAQTEALVFLVHANQTRDVFDIPVEPFIDGAPPGVVVVRRPL